MQLLCCYLLSSTLSDINTVTHGDICNCCVKTVSFIIHATKKCFNDRGKKEKNQNHLTDLLSTVYNKNILEPGSISSPQKMFLSDCNTRQTSIKQAERNESMSAEKEWTSRVPALSRDTLTGL